MQQVAAGLALEATDLDIFIRVTLPEFPGGPQQPIVTPCEKLKRMDKAASTATM